MATNKAVRAAVFTWNNPDTTELPELDAARYVVWQLERGESGTPHIQGYVEFTKPVKLGGMKKWLPKAHFEERRGTREQARDYCMKEDTRVDGPWERGTFETQQGRRSDLAAAVEAVKRGGIQAAIRDTPEVYIKYARNLHMYAEAIEQPPRDDDFVPRPWQARVLDIIKQPADRRTIVWVWETVGNVGKSRLVDHILRNYGGVLLDGKVADMAHAYSKQPVVLFDVPRTAIENMNHLCGFAEKLKNGALFSSKYESKMKLFAPPHVLFFANVPPPTDAWSADRLVEIDLNEPLPTLDVVHDI